MKITVYTIKDCTFSKQEKEYLNANKLAFEEKDLETNKDFLTEMLAISNSFAGTPVTRVEKDDGTISVLKGFTKEEFDTTFGLTASQPAADAVKPVEETPKIEETKTPTEAVPPIETVSPAPISANTPIQPKTDLTDSTVSTDSTVPPDPLKSVMDDLQSKSQPVEPSAEQTPAAPPPADAPAIPDFPAK